MGERELKRRVRRRDREKEEERERGHFAQNSFSEILQTYNFTTTKQLVSFPV